MLIVMLGQMGDESVCRLTSFISLGETLIPAQIIKNLGSVGM
jgi:hypothetical protein